jgi:hypothetical protein
MKKIFTILFLSLACSAPRDDFHQVQNSTDSAAIRPKPKRPCGCNNRECHLKFYQNGDLVQDYDTVEILEYGPELKFIYQGKKYRSHMDYIMELFE